MSRGRIGTLDSGVSFELLEDGVLVEVTNQLEGIGTVGTSSFIISYVEFTTHLKEQQEASGQIMSGLEKYMSVWGTGSAVNVPENTIEVEMIGERVIKIRQMIGGNRFPILTVDGSEVDTSRVIVDFTVDKDEMVVKDIAASTFTGLMYGYHKSENIVPNEFLTQKLKVDMEGSRVGHFNNIRTEEIIRNITAEDISRSEGGTFVNEVERVKVEGGAIRWGEVKC